MNKYSIGVCNRFNNNKHIFKIMRITLCLLFLSVMISQASITYSQETNISVILKSATIKEVCEEIEKNSIYNFVFSGNASKIANKKVDIEANSQDIAQVLDNILSGTTLTYHILDNQIVVYEENIKADNAKSSVELAEKTVVQQKPPVVSLSGTVSDKEGGPLPGVNIHLKSDRTVGTSTDLDGYYKIVLLPENETLVFSFIGMKDVEIALSVDMNPVLNVVMETDEFELGEVVVTGMFNKTKDSFTGAVTNIGKEDLQLAGNRNLLTSIRNIDPSFNMLENNMMGSDPNHIPDIVIRGNASLPNVNNLDEIAGLNSPLVILDGFESSLQKMLDINVQEVESVTILKDAAATAIYGSRGSNGVIVITTTKPAPGKMRVSYKGELNTEFADLRDYNLLDAREKLELEHRMGYYNRLNAANDIEIKRYYNFLLNEINQGVNTNWLKIPLRTGVGQRHNLSITGGENAFRYSVSAQWNDVAGVMKGSNRRTFNGTINLSYVFKSLRFSNQTMVTEGVSDESPYGAFSDYARLNPYWRPYDDKGNALKLLGNPGDRSYIGRYSSLPTSPLFNATLEMINKSRRSQLINNTSIELLLQGGFRARVQFGISKDNATNDVFRPAEHTAFANYATQDLFRRGDYRYNVSGGHSIDGSLNLQYSKEIAEKHVLFTGVDYNVRQTQFSSLMFMAEGFTNARLNNMSMALQYAQGMKPVGTESLVRTMGLTGNANYIYDDKYFTDFSVRMDGSSQFGRNNRMAPFWAAGLGWNIHNEGFLKDNDNVNQLRVRGSVGTTGSQNFPAYQSLSTYRYYLDDRYFNWNGAYLLGLGNENLKWQQAMQYNIGFNLDMFDNRLSIVGDYYISKTKNLLSSIDLPASNGFPDYVENVGDMKNEGFELRATGVLIKNTSKRVFWSVTASAAHNRNKIVSISNAMKEAQKDLRLTPSEGVSPIYLEGYSVNTLWVVPSLGIDPSTGKEVYKDKDGKPTYVWNGEDLRAMGLSEPKVLGNISSLFRYKDFSVNVIFGYRAGGQQYNSTLISKVENADYGYNVDARVFQDRWQNPGDKTAFKGLDVLTPTYRSSRFVQNEYTLACQNIYFEYMLRSASLRESIGLSHMQFGISMADPFRFSTIKQERGTAYPFSRQVSFTISATF